MHDNILVKNCAEVGDVMFSVAYDGMIYYIVDVSATLVPENGKQICRYGEAIKTKCREQYPVMLFELDYTGCDILAFREGNRNAVVMSDGGLNWDDESTWGGMVDRSPCGTGTSAVMALKHSRGQLHLHNEFVHESIIGTKFVGEE